MKYRKSSRAGHRPSSTVGTGSPQSLLPRRAHTLTQGEGPRVKMAAMLAKYEREDLISHKQANRLDHYLRTTPTYPYFFWRYLGKARAEHSAPERAKTEDRMRSMAARHRERAQKRLKTRKS